MVGPTSSISSNEGRGVKTAVTGRGYSLTAPTTTQHAPMAGSTQSSRTQTPPPPVVQNSTAANLSTTNSPAASSRHALGITHGWGVGLAHSGSYLGEWCIPIKPLLPHIPPLIAESLSL